MFNKTIRCRQTLPLIPQGLLQGPFHPTLSSQICLKASHHSPSDLDLDNQGWPQQGSLLPSPNHPYTCDKTAPRAIHWIVMVFHSFKAHLNPIAIDGESGKVKARWLRLYQNNLYIHLQGQMKEAAAAKRPVPPTPKPPPTALSTPSQAPPPPENLLESKLSKLCQEISKLRDRLTNYIMSHEACCGCHSNSPSDSSDEEVTTGITPPPQAPPPILLNLLPDGLLKPAANPLSWLVTAVNQQGLPYTFRDSIIIPSPLTPSTSFPEGTLEVVKVKFGNAPPLVYRYPQRWGTQGIYQGLG
ncbi:hypothetical protein EDC04DRAFT_2903105 [Pisolithus marmoratus]|nr:hypothetical protein EDC04DRAFT_2903105 [Pisolithus marmoratus]